MLDLILQDALIIEIFALERVCCLSACHCSPMDCIIHLLWVAAGLDVHPYRLRKTAALSGSIQLLSQVVQDKQPAEGILHVGLDLPQMRGSTNFMTALSCFKVY